MKKIISTALTVIMILTSVLAVIPVTAFAAGASSSDAAASESLTLGEIKNFINKDYLEYDFDSAEEMLAAELADKRNLLVYASSANGAYTIYVNRYSGFVYYVNNITGQILTSNPIDPAHIPEGASSPLSLETRQTIMSQIEISYVESANSTAPTAPYNSTKWAALYSQISVSHISGGIRVQYTLGDTSTRFLLPGRISAENYLTYILKPMVLEFEETYKDAMTSVGHPELADAFLGEDAANNQFIKYDPFVIYADGSRDENVVNNQVLRTYLNNAAKIYNSTSYTPRGGATITYDKISHVYAEKLDNLNKMIQGMGTKFGLKNPKSYLREDGTVDPARQEMYDKMIADYPISAEKPIYVFTEKDFENNTTATLRQYSNYIKQYCTEYTFDMMYEDEEECGFEYVSAQKPAFRCSLEYTFNADGSLNVRLPANSITFDETVYILKEITPLRYFGYGDMSDDGYIFFPDGSGSILDFKDFYNDDKKLQVSMTSAIYGQDYCYSTVAGAHRELITMPVYGVVSTVKANALTKSLYGVDSVKNGYFAIIEEGSSLATLGFASGGSSHKYTYAYAYYNPYPTDSYELAETVSVSVGGLGTNTMVAETKYSGSYVTRIVMLTDETVGNSYYGKGNFYDSSYTGMAGYYRNYLKANGTLTALELANENLPLYIEALGAMTILSKFLTFPVEKAIPLTTFNDIKTMYTELSTASTHIKDLIKEYEGLAAEEENDFLRAEYEHKAEKYKAIADDIEDVKNINFRLTGFANGGMNFTYPTKLKWESCLGGASDFEDLVSFSKSESDKKDFNFAIYPDFDFLYINNTSMFDGIGVKGNVSRMIDNRYASKQVYNSVIQEFETFFTLVISSDTLLEHFASFNEKYSEFNLSKISVSTLGSDLNSSFDKENTVDRDASMKNSIALLEEMVYQNQYEVMMDSGNIYAAKYATHILNASTDFSNFRYSSYAVPFVGMILHGYVNYAGAPMNYSGSPDYDILRAIESGAAPYYILCYQNTAYMKDDEVLSKYYGVDYANWYDEILVTYKKLNDELKGLQLYEIVAHQTVIVERTADKTERKNNYDTLKAELLDKFSAQLYAEVNAYVAQNGADAKVEVDVEKLYSQFKTILAKYTDLIDADLVERDGKKITALKDAIISEALRYTNEFPGTGAVDSLKYTALKDEKGVAYTNYREYSEYKFTTDSVLTDGKNYDATDYTEDNGNVVMVTYKKGDDIVRFVLNYNIDAVDVRLEDGTVVTIGRYGYHRIDN